MLFLLNKTISELYLQSLLNCIFFSNNTRKAHAGHSISRNILMQKNKSTLNTHLNITWRTHFLYHISSVENIFLFLIFYLDFLSLSLNLHSPNLHSPKRIFNYPNSYTNNCLFLSSCFFFIKTTERQKNVRTSGNFNLETEKNNFN